MEENQEHVKAEVLDPHGCDGCCYKCPECGGSGKDKFGVCPGCYGSGERADRRQLYEEKFGKGTGEVGVELISAKQHLRNIDELAIGQAPIQEFRFGRQSLKEFIENIQSNAHTYGKQEGARKQRKVDAKIMIDKAEQARKYIDDFRKLGDATNEEKEDHELHWIDYQEIMRKADAAVRGGK